MSKQNFHLPTWRRKPTADEAAPDIADSELVPSESAARPTRRKHGKRTYVIGGALLALAACCLIGLILPAGLAHSPKMHKGYDLYSAAVPIGLVAFFLRAVLYLSLIHISEPTRH